MRLGARILSFIAVMVLVAGCSHKPDDTGAVSTGGDMNSAMQGQNNAPPVTENGAATPGSEQDLVVNVGDRVFFALDKSDLTTESRTTVEKQAQWLKTYPNVNVMIEGHCDERGTREYNLALGEKRASSVRSYLIANGIDAKRIQTISYGKERPAVLGSDENAWAQNRRAVLVVQ
jgi:peptidoglycan-associated lipoprotein